MKNRPSSKMKKSWAVIVDSAFENKIFEEKLAQSMWYRMESFSMDSNTQHDYNRWFSLQQQERDKWLNVAHLANRSIGDHWKVMINEWLTRWWCDHGEIGDIPGLGKIHENDSRP